MAILPVQMERECKIHGMGGEHFRQSPLSLPGKKLDCKRIAFPEKEE